MSLLQLRKSYTNKVSDLTDIYFSTRSFELRWLWVCLSAHAHARITLCPHISYNVSFIEGINWQQSNLTGTLMNLLVMLGCAAVSVLQPEGSHTLGTQTLHTASSLRYTAALRSQWDKRREESGLWPHWPSPSLPAGSLQGQHQYLEHWEKLILIRCYRKCLSVEVKKELP